VVPLLSLSQNAPTQNAPTQNAPTQNAPTQKTPKQILAGKYTNYSTIKK
jgi:hypothetical protein